MSISSLLGWAASTQKTGVLEVERNRICRRVELRKGWIGACSSDDPPSRLGQQLLSQGKIDETQLSLALAKHESTGKTLGSVLVGEGLLTSKELKAHVAVKAEDTIRGLFEWDDGVFRFFEGATLDPDQVEVSLSAEQAIAIGEQHRSELQRMRETFTSSGIVLERVTDKIPAEVMKSKVSRHIYESIDGQRMIGEILLHARAPEFLVVKLLHYLHRREAVRVVSTRQVSSEAATILDVHKPVQFSVGSPPYAVAPKKPGPPSKRTAGEDGLDAEMQVASRLLDRGEFEAALELANASYRSNPESNYLRRTLRRIETTYTEELRRHALSDDRVPVVLSRMPSSATSRLTSEEAFLLTLIDDVADVRTIIWLAPLREVDVLRTLRQLLKRGLIELRPATGATAIEADALLAREPEPPDRIHAETC